MRTVNVHEAKTQFSRLIDAAHAGETILVAKDGKPWARLVPLEPDRPLRQPGPNQPNPMGNREQNTNANAFSNTQLQCAR